MNVVRNYHLAWTVAITSTIVATLLVLIVADLGRRNRELVEIQKLSCQVPPHPGKVLGWLDEENTQSRCLSFNAEGSGYSRRRM